MKAVVLTKDVVDDQEKYVEVKDDFPEPLIIAGSVKVRPCFTRIGSNTKAWSLGKYILPAEVMKNMTPWIPGPTCVGIVDDVGSDVYGIKAGQYVYTSALAESIKNDDSIPRDPCLIGWIPSSTPSPLFQQYKNGCLAEKVLIPAGSVYPLPESIQSEEELIQYLHVGSLSIAYGAVSKGGVKIGDTMLVNGAYGGLGSMAVQIGLLFRCKRIYCVGRSKEKLERLKVGLEMSFESASKILVLKTYDELGDLCDVDVGIDFIGNVEDPKPTETCLKTIKTGGSYVCCGGSKAELRINYSQLLIRQLKLIGSFMFERDVPMKVIRLIDVGVLKVPKGEFTFVEFNEKDVNFAIERNAEDRTLDMVLRINKLK